MDRDTEVTGPIEMRLWASSSALDTDFTAKLIDVYPPSDNFPDGLAFNITDSIIRARYRNGWDSPEDLEPGRAYELVFQLYPTSNIFRKGHRIRLDVSSSNWPRFDVNPNTGGPHGGRQGLHDGHPDHLPRPCPGLPRHPAAARLTIHDPDARTGRHRVPRCEPVKPTLDERQTVPSSKVKQARRSSSPRELKP